MYCRTYLTRNFTCYQILAAYPTGPYVHLRGEVAFVYYIRRTFESIAGIKGIVHLLRVSV